MYPVNLPENMMEGISTLSGQNQRTALIWDGFATYIGRGCCDSGDDDSDVIFGK